MNIIIVIADLVNSIGNIENKIIERRCFNFKNLKAFCECCYLSKNILKIGTFQKGYEIEYLLFIYDSPPVYVSNIFLNKCKICM